MIVISLCRVALLITFALYSQYNAKENRERKRRQRKSGDNTFLPQWQLEKRVCRANRLTTAPHTRTFIQGGGGIFAEKYGYALVTTHTSRNYTLQM